MPIASVVKGDVPDDLEAITRYFETQLPKLGVAVKLGVEVDPELVGEKRPDVVVLATGAKSAGAAIPGGDRGIVVDSGELRRTLQRTLALMGWKKVRQATSMWMPVGKRVVILGGRFDGCQLAEFLVKRGRAVTLAETGEAVGDGLVEHMKAVLLPWLERKGAVMLPQVVCEEITDAGVTLTTAGGERRSLEADTVIAMAPLAADADLAARLEGMVEEIHSIGSCREPGLIVDAIADGARVGHAI
jgi:NADH dehydrogenase FAD-containing subunit